jgi:protein TonB
MLAKSSRDKTFIQRSGAMAAVVGLHLVGLVAAFHARARQESPVEATAIHMAFLQETSPAPQPAPELPPPPLEQIAPPRIEAPMVLIPIIDVPEAPVLTAAQAEPPPVAEAPVVVRSTEPVLLREQEVEYIRRPEPQMPRAARQARLQGEVLVWALIDTEGRPREVRVHRSSGHEQLDRAGCEAVLRALFRPYQRDGESRSAQVIIPIEFRFASSRAAKRF